MLDQDTPPVRHVRAWLLLDAALAVHVVDEALTGVLDFYTGTRPPARSMDDRPTAGLNALR